MRFLITGVGGFAGRHLAAALQADGHEVFGTTRTSARGIADAPLPADHLAVCDLQEAALLSETVRRLQPQGIFHLAALTNVPASFADPQGTYRTNLLGSLNVFAAARDAGTACRVLWVGSSDAYGEVEPTELPVTERQPFRPLSPYAVSKAAADLAAYQWSRTQDFNVVRVRPFNHTGPGQAPDFVCSGFARQIIAVERGEQPAQIEVGNLDVVRDFSDVRDVVRAYILAWERGGAGEAYNVCSGNGRTIRSVLETLMQLAGVTATTVTAPQRQRRVDIPALVGNATKLRQATGWLPKYNWEQTLRDLLDDWRGRRQVESSK